MSVGQPDYNPVVDSNNASVEAMTEMMQQMMEDAKQDTAFLMEHFGSQQSQNFSGFTDRLDALMDKFTANLENNMNFDNPFGNGNGNGNGNIVQNLPGMPPSSDCGCHNHGPQGPQGPSQNPFLYVPDGYAHMNGNVISVDALFDLHEESQLGGGGPGTAPPGLAWA